MQVIDDATSAMNDIHDAASTLLDDNVALGEFLDEQLARTKAFENAETKKSLKLKIMKHLLDLVLLDMNCLRYRKVMLWMRRQLETFLLAMIGMILRNYYAN